MKIQSLLIVQVIKYMQKRFIEEIPVFRDVT